MEANQFKKLSLYEGDEIHIKFHSGSSSNYVFIYFVDAKNLILAENEDGNRCKCLLYDIKSIRKIQSINNNTNHIIYRLPRTDKDGNRLDEEARRKRLEQLYTDYPYSESIARGSKTTELDEFFTGESGVFNIYGTTNIDSLNKAQRKRYYNFLNKAWSILEESANYILFISPDVSKQYGILSPRTIRRRISKESAFPNESIYEVEDKKLLKIQREMYNSGIYKNEYQDIEFDLVLESIYPNSNDLEAAKLFSQSYTQNEVSEIMNTSRSKVRTHRTHLRESYKAVDNL